MAPHDRDDLLRLLERLQAFEPTDQAKAAIRGDLTRKLQSYLRGERPGRGSGGSGTGSVAAADGDTRGASGYTRPGTVPSPKHASPLGSRRARSARADAEREYSRPFP